MRKIVVPVLALCLIAAAPLAAQSVTNPDKGEASPDFTPEGGCSAIADDTYDGTIGSMTCVVATGADLTITDVNVNLRINHTWIGDLTVKVVSPLGTVSTVQSRAGYAEPADDGTGCCGDSSDLSASFPVTYDDGGATSAEDMGSTILGGDVACDTDGLCIYDPFPDTGLGVNLADFNDENGAGDWMICVGDSAAGDLGEICDASVTIEGFAPSPPFDVNIPTLNIVGLLALLAALAAAGLIFLRRR